MSVSARSRTGENAVDLPGFARGPQLVLLVVGILLLATNLRAALTSVGPLLSDIRLDIGLSATEAGVLTALPLVCFAAFSPLAPLAARRLGLEWTLWLGLLVLTAGILSRSLVTGAGVWIGTVLIGASIAAFNVLLPSLVKRDFPDRVAQLSGGYSATQSVVAAVASGVAVPIAGAEPGGWRLALGCWAGLSLLAAVVWLPRLRTRAAGVAPPVAVAGSYRSPWTSAIGWQVTAFMGLQSLVFYVIVAWLPSIEHDNGVATSVAGWHLFAYLISAVVANLLAPVIMRRLPDQRLAGLLAGGLIGVGVAGLLWAPPITVLWVLCAGFGAGLSLVLCLSLFSLRSVNFGQAAALSGMAQSIGYAMAACGPILIGWLRDLSGSWALPLSVLLCLVAALCVVAQLAGRARVIE